MKEKKNQAGSAILGVFGLLLGLLAGAYLGLVSFIAFLGRGPNPIRGSIALILAIAAIVAGFTSLRVSGLSYALGSRQKKGKTENEVLFEVD